MAKGPTKLPYRRHWIRNNNTYLESIRSTGAAFCSTRSLKYLYNVIYGDAAHDRDAAHPWQLQENQKYI